MHEWLYGKEGYYTKERTIGKEGDFYTAVSTSMFFGGSIAKRLISTIEEGFLSPNTYVVEIGAHKGYLLADMIQFIYTLQPTLLKNLTFVIVEPFAANAMMQKRYFQESFGETISLLHVKSLEELCVDEAFFVANEIFDAFPCEVIYNDKMLMVENEKVFFETMDTFTCKKAEAYGVSKGELCLEYEAFATSMAKSAKRFEFISFDYGDKEARGDFSLRVYANHQVYPFFGLSDLVEDSLREQKSFVEYFTKSDITYDVTFNHLFKAFEMADIRLHGYMTQMKALVDFGLIELLELFSQHVTSAVYEKEMNRVKPLIDPSFMGERFKMVSFRKGER